MKVKAAILLALTLTLTACGNPTPGTPGGGNNGGGTPTPGPGTPTPGPGTPTPGPGTPTPGPGTPTPGPGTPTPGPGTPAQPTITDNTILDKAITLTVGEPVKAGDETGATSSTTAVYGVIAGQDRTYHYYTFTAKAGDHLRLTVKTKPIFKDSTLDPIAFVYLPDKDSRKASTRVEYARDDNSGPSHGNRDREQDDVDLKFNAPTEGVYTIKVTSAAIFRAEQGTGETDDKPTNTYQLNLFKRP